MTDTGDLSIVIEDDGPVLIIIFLLVCLVSIAVQILDNARQRRKLAVVAGDNQEMRANRRMFFYTVLIIGLLTLVANYIMGITSSLAAGHIDRAEGSLSPLDLPGIAATLVTAALYSLAILLTAKILAKKERLGFPEMLADLNHAWKLGALESSRQIAHYKGEFDQLRTDLDKERAGAFTGGDFDFFFTAHESSERPRFIEQLRYLQSAPHHRARTRNFQRNMLLNYRITAGKWILPFALLAGLSLFFTVWELIAANAGDGDYSLALAWAVACLLGLAATGGQYFCDLSKALLESRRQYISNETAAQCAAILAEATADWDAGPAAKSAAGAIGGSRDGQACDGHDRGDGGGWEPMLRVGRWEFRRRKTPR